MFIQALTRKLRAETNLDDDDIRALESLMVIPKDVPAGTTLAREGDRPERCCLVVDGFVTRSKTNDVGRQILSIHVPGDIPDLQSLHLHVMDHDLKALSSCTVGYIAHEALRRLTRSRPLVAEALWRETLVDSAIFREWIVNVGRRDAQKRMAHLFVEMKRRLALVGIGDGSFRLPLTQIALADALGLSPVHVNRSLQALRAKGLVEFKNAEVTIRDIEKLAEAGDFNDLYLHQRAEL